MNNILNVTASSNLPQTKNDRPIEKPDKDFSKIMTNVRPKEAGEHFQGNHPMVKQDGALTEKTNAVQKPKDTQKDQKTEYAYGKKQGNVREKQDVNPEDPAVQEAVKDAAEDFEKKVKDAVSEALDVPEETVTEAMELLQLSALDLTSPQNLTALVGEITEETDSLSILSMDNVSDLMQGIAALTEDVKQSLPTDIESAKEILGGILPPEAPDMLALSEAAPEDEILLSGNGQEALSTDETLQNTAAKDQASSLGKAALEEHTDAAGIREAMEQSRGEAPSLRTERPAHEDRLQTEAPDEDARDITLDTEALAAAENTDTSEEDGSTGSQSENPANRNRDLFTEIRQNVPEGIQNQPQNTLQPEQPAFQPETVPVTESYTDVDPRELVNQIAEQARVTITEEVQTMEMILNPEHLGRIRMEVSTQDGHVTARLMTENETVKEALENQIASLRENLSTQGYRIEEVEVSVETRGFDQTLEENQMHENARQQEEERAAEELSRASAAARRGINFNDEADDLSDLTEAEELTARMMRENGNSMNITA